LENADSAIYNMKRTRLILADDHKVFLETLKHFLEPRFEVVGTATDGIALSETALEAHPDVIIADMGMPLLNGLDAVRKLKRTLRNVKVIFLTMNEDPYLAINAMREGASGYVLKKAAGAELLEAVYTVLKGKSYVSPEIARSIQEAFIRDPEGKLSRKVLSQRQREVLQLLAEGKSMKQAADILAVTPRTIAFHKYKLMDELGIKTTAELIQFAIRNHVIMRSNSHTDSTSP
jgi:DNA-binding NarL/FixJ family response regulator